MRRLCLVVYYIINDLYRFSDRAHTKGQRRSSRSVPVHACKVHLRFVQFVVFFKSLSKSFYSWIPIYLYICIYNRRPNIVVPQRWCSNKLESSIRYGMYTRVTRWRHKMETFSTLLAIYAGNSPVSGEFPSQRPVTRSFHARINDWVNNREAGDLRCRRAHYDVTVMKHIQGTWVEAV